MWNFQLNSAKTSLLDTCGGSLGDTYDLPFEKGVSNEPKATSLK